MEQILLKVNFRKLKLLCLDGSKHSEEALGWFFENVHRDGEEVGLVHVHVLPTLPTFGMYSHAVVLTDIHANAIQKSIDESQAVVKKYKDACAEKGVNAITFIQTCQGSIGNTICEIAKEHGSMIVMGQRGLGIVRRTIYGSVSDYVIHHAGIPVTVVPSSTKKN